MSGLWRTLSHAAQVPTSSFRTLPLQAARIHSRYVLLQSRAQSVRQRRARTIVDRHPHPPPSSVPSVPGGAPVRSPRTTRAPLSIRHSGVRTYTRTPPSRPRPCCQLWSPYVNTGIHPYQRAPLPGRAPRPTPFPHCPTPNTSGARHHPSSEFVEPVPLSRYRMISHQPTTTGQHTNIARGDYAQRDTR